MNAEFKDWILRQFDQTDSKATKQKKLDFLRTLKLEPDKAEQWISENIASWSVAYQRETKESAMICFPLDACLLLEALQEHFATDLAAITQ